MKIFSIPIIKISDVGGEPRRIGSNSHDTLHIDDSTGGIQYLNLQCSEGTRLFDGESNFKFCGEFYEYSPYKQIEFVSLSKLTEIVKKELEIEELNQEYDEATKAYLKICEKAWKIHEEKHEKQMQEFMKSYFKEKE